MLNSRNIHISFSLILVALIITSLKFGFMLAPYLAILGAYLTLNIYGSTFIQSNYFLQSSCRGNPDVKSIALTFDDGPNMQTEEVLNILKSQKVPAAFFVIGKNVAGNQSLLKRMVDEGHIIGNHSYSHNFWFSMKPAADMARDIAKCNDVIEQITGKRPAIFRPPYGVTNPMVAKAIKIGGYTSIGWSLRTFDTTAGNREKLLKNALDKLQNGDVVLFHEHGPYTTSVLIDFIASARLKGFEIIRPDKLLGVKAYI